MNNTCIFCFPPAHQVVEATSLVRIVRDSHPVSPGHTLVVPRRHVASFFETTTLERAEMFEAIVVAKLGLDETHAPGGYTVGINDGPVAGQSVKHCHVHVIPRFAGDVEDPRGGVRWVIPDKARYW